MSDNEISKHRQELHDAFFPDRDQELLDFLQFESDSLEEPESSRLLALAGVHDAKVAEAIQQAGVTSASMTAFMLLPLVRLAWADSKLQNGEFESLLKAAEDDGIQYGTPAYRLLNRWLEEKPTQLMLDAWWKYAQALTRELDEASLSVFREATLGRARRLAQSSGGIFGMGEKISESERHVLDDLTHALSKQR
jgi:hypothetical protein